MAVVFTQYAATAATCTEDSVAYCSGASTRSSGTVCRAEAANGASADSALYGFELTGEGTGMIGCVLTCLVAAGVVWDAGTWTINLEVSTANMNLTITEAHLCRVDSSCVNQETIGSNTGLSVSLGTTGVTSFTVAGAAVTPGAGDKVVIVLVGDNGSMNQALAVFTATQNIDSPFTAPAPEQAARAIKFPSTLDGLSAGSVFFGNRVA